MKKFKKLIPALCMLLISAVLVGTSTYAWFSMNPNVSAIGMTINAKSNSEFLVIVEGTKFDGTATSPDVTSSAAATSLFPVAPASSTEFENETAVKNAANWHYAYSNNLASSTKAGDYQTLTSLTDYVASESFTIGLNKNYGVETSANNIKLTSVELPADKAICCVVVCGDKVKTYRASDTTSSLDLGVKATKDGTVVTVYYFIDGDNTNVTTNNKNNLTGSIELTFSVA